MFVCVFQWPNRGGLHSGLLLLPASAFVRSFVRSRPDVPAQGACGRLSLFNAWCSCALFAILVAVPCRFYFLNPPVKSLLAKALAAARRQAAVRCACSLLQAGGHQEEPGACTGRASKHSAGRKKTRRWVPSFRSCFAPSNWNSSPARGLAT